jgi:hypothetical protein
LEVSRKMMQLSRDVFCSAAKAGSTHAALTATAGVAETGAEAATAGAAGAAGVPSSAAGAAGAGAVGAVGKQGAQSDGAEKQSAKPTADISNIRDTEAPPDYSHFNGEVVIRYNHYKKKFPVVAGCCSSAQVDAEYYLSFAFPNSKLRVTLYGPSDFTFEDMGHLTRPHLREFPEGTYWGLDPEVEYWVEVEEDAAERRAYEARQDQLALEGAAKRMTQEEEGGESMIVVKTESCSCIEGNPCLDRYACKSWEKRYEVAKAHGWKGFQ